jgi:DeoR/GlpR family transcriptional regulator of sugar metabolism
MHVVSRRDKLLDLVRVRGFAALPDLASELNVSESTIRRDLEVLEGEGAAKRTHGGVFYTGPSPKLQHFDKIQARNHDKKKEIARFAASLVEDGDTILLDGGSTTYELARLLVGRALQVVTNSLPVANLFIGSETADLVMIGGYVHAKSGVALGPYANEMLKELNCRSAFMSVAGIHEEGLFNGNLLLVETERAMMNSADQVYFLADSTKFGRKSLSKLCELSESRNIVVDDGLDQQWKTRISDSGISLHVAPSENK